MTIAENSDEFPANLGNPCRIPTFPQRRAFDSRKTTLNWSDDTSGDTADSKILSLLCLPASLGCASGSTLPVSDQSLRWPVLPQSLLA
jgi:hypothetical protein